MSVLNTVEYGIVANLKAGLGELVKSVEPMGGAWTADTLSRVMQFSPSIQVSLIDARVDESDSDLLRMTVQWAVYVITNNATEDDRRVDAYRLIERVINTLQLNHVAKNSGLLNLVDIKNLFSEPVQNMGGSVYALTFNHVVNMDTSVEATGVLPTQVMAAFDSLGVASQYTKVSS